MSEALVIRFKSDSTATVPGVVDSPVEWLTIDTSGTKHGNAQTGTLSEAAAMAAGRKVIVFVPGTDVLLCEPVLPPKSGAKLLQIIPFALEEQLAADVEDLHFAVGKRETRPGTPVAVVARELVDKWLAALATAGLQPEALYAETSVLPVTPNGITLLVDGTRVYVQRDGTPGAVLDVEPLIEALQLALASGEEAREHVTIYLTEDVYERERDLFEGLREFTASLQLKLLPDGVLQLLATNAFQSAPVNLLQGSYAVKTKLKLSFRPWRYAAMLAATFLVLHVGLKAWQSYELQRTEARLDDEITQVFQQGIPGAPVPDTMAARKQFEMRLGGLRGTGPVGGMLSALNTLGEALAQAPGTNIEALSYRENTLDLRVLAPSVDALDKIQHVATEHGVATEIQSASPRDSKIEGRLQLKSPRA
ncbi:MAG TPA: type II secretion system protein GspL [Steroidobacteraceae bacterium]|jgi:general secretion pathway protein L